MIKRILATDKLSGEVPVKMSSPYITTAEEVRGEEHSDIKKLNNKLELYVNKVRQLDDKGGNPGDFLATLKSVDDDVRKLKALYETELDNLRRQLNDANKSKNDTSAELERYQRLARDFGDRFQVENEKNGRLISDVCTLQKHVTELEHALNDARDALATPQRQLAVAKTELAGEQLKSAGLGRELEQERAKCQQLKDQVIGLQQELDFKDKVSAEQLRDANTHLDQSKAVIDELQSHAKDLESHNATLPRLLEEMRKKTDEEVRQYRDEITETANKNIDELKTQNATHLNQVEQMRQECAKLQAEIDGLENKLRAAESRARDMQAQKFVLEDHLKHEKSRSLEQTRALERKLRDINKALMDKMSDINMGKDAQVSMRAEIESMRLILEEEENRLGPLRNQASQSYGRAKSVSYDDTRTGYAQKMDASTKRNLTPAGPIPQSRSAHARPESITRPNSDGPAWKEPAPAQFGVKTKNAARHSIPTSRDRHVLANFNGPAWRDQHPHSLALRQKRSQTFHAGLPRIVTDNVSSGGYTTGKMYTTSYDIRGDGTMTNYPTGHIHYAPCYPMAQGIP